MDNGTWDIEEFNLRNSGLASLASSALVELDCYLRDEFWRDLSIMHLSRILEKLVESRRSFNSFSPDVHEVLGYAILGRENFGKLFRASCQTPEEFLNAYTQEGNVVFNGAKKLVPKLQNYRVLSREKQTELMNFCVRLSRECGLYHTENFGMRSWIQ